MGRRIGIDIDDTLGVFISDFLDFYNELKRTNFRLEDIYTLPIREVLGLTEKEERVWFDAYNEKFPLTEGKTIRGTIEVINKLHRQGDYLMAVTGRSEQIKEKTQLWLDQKYSGKISELHCKPHGIRKAEMKLRLDVIVEDNSDEALAFAEAGVRTYLLDYPWNRKVDSRENIVRVCSWEELGRIL